MIDPGTLPWTWPVPVRASRFVPVDPSYAPWNIEVALDRIQPFAFDPASLPADQLLYCDLQTNADVNAPRRLGAGRAGIHRERSVKGVGRTPLAANWNDTGDAWHASGYLATGSALRERLISCALTARGAGHTIVQVESVLVGALGPAETASAQRFAASALPLSPPVDQHTLALSVRTGGFARMSNFLWALHHVEPSPGPVGSLLLTLLACAAEGGTDNTDGTVQDAEGTPDEIADALMAAAVRSLDCCDAYVRQGIYWVSFHNNLALDGRFLDLETPLYVGAPWFGLLRARRPAGTPPSEHVVGMETFKIARQWRLFLASVHNRLRFMAAELVEVPALKTFLRALASAIKARMTTDRRLFSDESLHRRVVRTLAGALDLGTRERAVIAAVARAEAARQLHGHRAVYPPMTLSPLAETPASPTPTDQADYLAPGFVHERLQGRGNARAMATARAFTRGLTTLEGLTDRDAVLSAVPDVIASVTAAARRAGSSRPPVDGR